MVNYMSVAKTSREAYASIDASCNCRHILFTLRNCGARTRQELCDLTGLPINVVTGRVNELINSGRVKQLDKTKINPDTGKNCYLVEAR